MPTQNVNLSPQQSKFIRKSVDKGHFRNASEVVRAGLRLLEHQGKEDRLKLQRLRKITQDAFDQIDRGEHEEIGADQIDAFLDRAEARVPREKEMSYRLRFAKHAVRDIDEVLGHTIDHFGEEQLEEYKALIRMALADIVSHPHSPPMRKRFELHRDARTFSIARRGKPARHFFLLRFIDDKTIEIGCLLHDAMDLRQHLPEGYDPGNA